MGYKLPIVARSCILICGMCDFAARDSKVQIKEEIAAIILLDINKRRMEKGKIDDGRPGDG